MKRLEFTTRINAPRERVWHTMLDDTTYRDWTAAFSEGSRFEGDWSEGSVMRFLGPDGQGGATGMVTRVREMRPLERVAMTVIGVVENGVQIEAPGAWVGAIEEYTLRDAGQQTELHVVVDTVEQYAEMMDRGWKEALVRLKALAER